MIYVINGKDFFIGGQFEKVKERIILIFCLLSDSNSFTYLKEFLSQYPVISATIQHVIDVGEQGKIDSDKIDFWVLVCPIIGDGAYRFLPVFKLLSEFDLRNMIPYFILPDDAEENIPYEISRVMEEFCDDKNIGDFFVSENLIILRNCLIPITKLPVLPFEMINQSKTKGIGVRTPPPKVLDKTKKMVFYQKPKDLRFKRRIRNLLPS